MMIKRKYQISLKFKIPYFRQCQKLRNSNQYLTPTKAATFLFLLNHCDRETALRFSKRRICKWDTTTQLDGPATCRILVPEKKKEKMINGWQNVGIEQYYENKETVADLKQLRLDPDNEKIQRKIEQNEKSLKNDFKNRMATLTQFYSQLNEKYNIDPKNPHLKEQLRKKNRLLELQRNRPIQYLKQDGVRYIELLKEISADHDRPKSLLDQLNAFERFQIKEYKVKEKLPNQLFKNMQSNIQHDSEIYRNMEKQSQAVLNLIDSNDLAMTKKKTDHNLVTQKAIMFADDFNRAKYVYKVDKQIQMQRIAENPNEINSPISSQCSISIHKKHKSVTNLNEDGFERALKRYAHRFVNYNIQNGTNQVNMENLNQKIQDRKYLYTSQMKKIQKPQLSLDFTKNILEKTTPCDKDSTKAGTSFLKQRSYLISPFTSRN